MHLSTQGGVLATSAARWDSRWSHEHAHTNDYYATCCFAGVLSCGLTHLAVTPLDVAKCNMQVDPSKYKGLIGSIKTIAAEEARYDAKIDEAMRGSGESSESSTAFFSSPPVQRPLNISLTVCFHFVSS